MKPKMALSRDVVAKAMKKSGRYGVTGFKQNAPPLKKPKSNRVTIGLSGMT